MKRSQIAPADRAHLRSWLARFAGRDDVAFRAGGVAGWRYVAEELAGAGVAAHVARPTPPSPAAASEPTTTPAPAGAAGRRLEVLDPPSFILECRALLKITIFGLDTTAWVQAQPMRCFSTRAPRPWARPRCAPTMIFEALRAAAAAHLSPTGQLQVATALDMLAALQARLDVLRHRLLAAARSLTGARVLAARLYGVGPSAPGWR